MRPLLVLVVAGCVAAAAASAATFPLRVVAEDADTITLGWDKQSGVDGYRFFLDTQAVSRTFDPARTSVRFRKGSSYGVAPLTVTQGETSVLPVSRHTSSTSASSAA